MVQFLFQGQQQDSKDLQKDSKQEGKLSTFL